MNSILGWMLLVTPTGMGMLSGWAMARAGGAEDVSWWVVSGASGAISLGVYLLILYGAMKRLGR